MRDIQSLILRALVAPLIVLVLASGAWGQGLRAELVHKILDEGPLYRLYLGWVQVTFPDGRVKILPYRTHLEPVVAQGRVYFFPCHKGTGGELTEEDAFITNTSSG
jgi:hypothetical protein